MGQSKNISISVRLNLSFFAHLAAICALARAVSLRVRLSAY
jgi:hypothetical protein